MCAWSLLLVWIAQHELNQACGIRLVSSRPRQCRMNIIHCLIVPCDLETELEGLLTHVGSPWTPVFLFPLQPFLPFIVLKMPIPSNVCCSSYYHCSLIWLALLIGWVRQSAVKLPVKCKTSSISLSKNSSFRLTVLVRDREHVEDSIDWNERADRQI